MTEGRTHTTPRLDRRRELEKCAKRLMRASEMEMGSPEATQSALWEVEIVRKRLPEIEASLRSRLKAIGAAP